MQFKEIEFKHGTSSNKDYQLDSAELKFEIESKARKWKSLEEDLKILMKN